MADLEAETAERVWRRPCCRATDSLHFTRSLLDTAQLADIVVSHGKRFRVLPVRVRRCIVRYAIVAVALVLGLCAAASGEIPSVMGYQGQITDNSGVPVANGSYTMRFRIYNAATGGTLLWDSYNQSVQVTGGVFNTELGASPQPALSLPFDEDYWLLVTFAGEDQLPRKRLGSVGYAHMASGLVPGTEVGGSVTSGTYAAIKGTNTASAGVTYGVYGQSSSGSGYGVYGYATATTGTTSGVYGETASASGYAGYFNGTGYFQGNLGVGTTTPSAKLTLGNVGTDVSFGNGAVYLDDPNKYFDFEHGMVLRGTGNDWAARFTSTDAMLSTGEIVGIYKEEAVPGATTSTVVPQGPVAVFLNDGSVGLGTTANLAPGLTVKTTNPAGWGYTGILFQGVGDQTAHAGLQLNGSNDLTVRNYSGGWYTNLVLKSSNGYFGFGQGMANPQHLIHLNGGAYSDGTSWVDATSKASSRDVSRLTLSQAREALAGLDPVTFRHRADENGELHVGFMVEDVPELVAMQDRKGLSAMQVAAVLAKVVQDQQKRLEQQDAQVAEQRDRLSSLEERLLALEQR
jgi:hypothetical protein